MRESDWRFLQLCLRVQCNGNALGLLRQYTTHTSLDWNSIQTSAATERLGPLIYDVVRDTGIVPPSVEQVLREDYYNTVRRNLMLWYELRLALRALATADIRVLVLKGVALAETVYRNIALRPMADVDLLVAPGDLARVIETLGPHGYVQPPLEMRAGTVAAYENEILLCAPGRAAVDIHWSLFDSPYHQHAVAMDWFWETARPLLIDGTPSLMLGAEATVLHLCGHVWLHHGGASLLWLHDVARTIAFDPVRLDWDELLRRARVCHLVLPTQRVVRRIVDEWAIPVSPDVLHRLAALQPSASEVRTFKQLTAEHRGVAQRFWDDICSIPGWRRRLRFAWTLLFPSPRYMRARYRIRHPLLLPVYYIYRWMLGVRSAV